MAHEKAGSQLMRSRFFVFVCSGAGIVFLFSLDVDFENSRVSLILPDADFENSGVSSFSPDTFFENSGLSLFSPDVDFENSQVY